MSDQKRNTGGMNDQHRQKSAQPNQDKQHSKNAGPRDNQPQQQPQQGRPSDQSQKNRDH